MPDQSTAMSYGLLASAKGVNHPLKNRLTVYGAMRKYEDGGIQHDNVSWAETGFQHEVGYLVASCGGPGNLAVGDAVGG